jgi:hypothetical protein
MRAPPNHKLNQKVLRRSVEPAANTVEKLDSRLSGVDFGGLKPSPD